MLSAEDKLLVDRYIDNTLTGIELQSFLARLENDESFRKEVSFHNKLIEGINEAEDHRLRQYVIDATGYRRRLVPMSLKLIITFLIITGGGITYWEYIGPGSNGDKRNFFTWNFSRKKEVIKPAEKEIAVEHAVPSSVNVAETPTIDSQSLSDTTQPEDIIVRKDQKLVSFQLQPIELMTDPDKDVQSTEEVSDVEKKNYNVEFWVSPVNYKGYKLQGEKLILFGIELPDEVQLYSIKDKLWLKYGKDFFNLQSNDNFESLIASNNLPTELK
jgi:hypothetical protein